MLITHERDKLINAVIFFAENTKFCGKIKLFKLMYFLDFEHFKETGRSVTGMDYFAWKMGPVPVALNEEIDKPEPDMAEKVSFSEAPLRNGNKMLTIKPQVVFDSALFSRRELRLMDKLAKEFRDSKAEDMIEATHLENMPWHEVYEVENRKLAHIPYDYALRRQEKDVMLELVAERNALVDHFSKS